jgi:type IV pilus assembly protein PilE
MPRSRGFTLIEVMITVAIVAILAAVAIPSYAEYIKRGRITEAVASLAGIRVKMEQYFQDNRVYNGATPACDPASIAPIPTDTDNFHYVCAVTAATYLVTANGQGALAGFSYSIDQANARSTVMTAPSTWPSNATCWVIRRDGSC